MNTVRGFSLSIRAREPLELQPHQLCTQFPLIIHQFGAGDHLSRRRGFYIMTEVVCRSPVLDIRAMDLCTKKERHYITLYIKGV